MMETLLSGGEVVDDEEMELTCERCGHRWTAAPQSRPREYQAEPCPWPTKCPNCGSSFWDQPPKYERLDKRGQRVFGHGRQVREG